jgi:hypothetical protein
MLFVIFWKAFVGHFLMTHVVALKRAVVLVNVGLLLATEAVQSSTLSLQGVHDVHSGDSLSLGVFGIGDGISNDVLEEYFQNSTCLLVD